jgi:CRP/FNR family cyclic AMP-dependent transcriptional regulator
MMMARRGQSAIRIERLQETRLFAHCTKDELRQIASLTTVKEVDAGMVLAEQGTVGREFFVITEGSATATRDGSWLADLGPGSFFGELALLDGGPRTATVVADSRMTLLVLSRTEFKSLQLTAPTVAYKMLVEVGARLRRIYEQRNARGPVVLSEVASL